MDNQTDPWHFRDDDLVERECLLFEAGDYPDRGVRVTPEDLRAIAGNSAPELPVRIEHLRESPFDGALGVITHLRVAGSQLWGTLRQPVEAWRFARRAGARALSVALDTAARRLVEVSFVCRPRVPAAQVFGEGRALFHTASLYEDAEGKEEPMTTVRQFAEGLIGYLRGVLGGADEPAEGEALAAERAHLAAEREALEERAVEQQIASLKREGLLRATDAAEGLARAILRSGGAHAVAFGDETLPIAQLFARFLAANGAVVPMGEMMRADPLAGVSASERLVEMAREAARRDNLPYVTAFARVSAAHPDLARQAKSGS